MGDCLARGEQPGLPGKRWPLSMETWCTSAFGNQRRAALIVPGDGLVLPQSRMLSGVLQPARGIPKPKAPSCQERRASLSVNASAGGTELRY